MNKNEHSGEDSAIIETIIRPTSQFTETLLGVADGVGGWQQYGLDSSYISSGVLEGMAELFSTEPGQTPQELITRSFSRLLERRERFAGGTTVCFGVFNSADAMLSVFNIGDSGALLYRKGVIAERTENDAVGLRPRQLFILPSEMLGLMNEDPEAQTTAATQIWALQRNDILVFATDGFHDNVAVEEARVLIEKEAANAEKYDQALASTIADALLTRAYYNSLDPKKFSPFAMKYYEHHKTCDYLGGKPDDISVIVGVVA